MTPSTMLPANEAVLKKIPDAYIKIMQTGNRMPASFTTKIQRKAQSLRLYMGI